VDVVVLCGGKGLRLRPLTEKIPKPLVYIKDKPLLQHILDFYSAWGFTRFILCIGYKGEMIREYFASQRKTWDITYVDSGDVDIIRRIYDTRDIVSDQFIVSYGDTIADVNLKKLIAFHNAKRGLVTITTCRMRSPFGIVFSDLEGLVYSFREKPLMDYWTNIGYMIFEKVALRHVRRNETLISFLERLISKGAVYSFRHEGVDLTVNTVQDIEEAVKDIDKFLARRGKI